MSDPNPNRNLDLRNAIEFAAKSKALDEQIKRDEEQLMLERRRYLDELKELRTIRTPDGKEADLFKQVERAAEEASSPAELKAFNDARSALSGLLADLIQFAEAGVVRRKMVVNDLKNTIADTFKVLKNQYQDEKSISNINKMNVVMPELNASIKLDETTNVLTVEGLTTYEEHIITDKISNAFKLIVVEWLLKNGYTGNANDMKFVSKKDASNLTKVALNDLYVNGQPTLQEYCQLDIRPSPALR